MKLKWFKDRKLEILLLLALAITAGVLRFYQINKLTFFSYDQARDALYIKRIIVDHKLRLIGTQSSIPGVYTPPMYYYLMAPFLMIFKLNPIGINFATAFLNTLAVLFLFLCIKSLTNNILVALVFSLLYSFNPTVVDQSRLAWNPNTMPFFSLIAVWCLFKILENPKKVFYYFILFFCVGININLHYSAVGLFLGFFLSIIFLVKKEQVIRGLTIGLGGLFLTLSPLLFFDLRHGFMITKNIINYFKVGTGGKIPAPPIFVGIWQKTSYLFGIVFGNNNIQPLLMGFFSLIAGLFVIKDIRNKKFLGFVVVYLTCIIFSSLYRGSFFSFYLTPFYPFAFIIFSQIVSGFSKNKIVFWGLLALFILIGFQNFSYSINNLKTIKADGFSRLMNISEFLAPKLQDNFNLVSVYTSSDRYDKNAVDYRYFLEAYFGKISSGWDPDDYKNANNLYILSQEKIADPIKSNIWEIEMFSPKMVENIWETNDVIVYHLIK